MVKKDARQLGLALGEAIAEMRRAAGKTQDELAKTARSCGLPWSRSSVAALETGRREVSAAELLLMPLVVGQAFGTFSSLERLLTDLGPVRLTATAVLMPSAHKVALAGDVGGMTIADLKRNFDIPLTRSLRAEQRQQEVDLSNAIRRLKAKQRLWPGANVQAMIFAEETALGEAERKAARKLGVPAVDIALVAFRLWGQSLTAERDERVQSSTQGDESPRTLQALRGRVTRQLVSEISDVLKPVNTRG